MFTLQGIPSPWANQSNQPGNDLSMNLLGSMMSSGSGNMQNLATTLVAQALQNKPGGMLIGKSKSSLLSMKWSDQKFYIFQGWLQCFVRMGVFLKRNQ